MRAGGRAGVDDGLEDMRFGHRLVAGQRIVAGRQLQDLRLAVRARQREGDGVAGGRHRPVAGEDPGLEARDAVVLGQQQLEAEVAGLEALPAMRAAGRLRGPAGVRAVRVAATGPAMVGIVVAVLVVLAALGVLGGAGAGRAAAAQDEDAGDDAEREQAGDQDELRAARAAGARGSWVSHGDSFSGG